MARSARTDIGNIPYHVLNRAVGRFNIFSTPSDYLLFLDVLREAQTELDMRVLAYVLMPNHWHLALYPKLDGDLGLFMHKLTNAHTRKVHTLTGTIGTGPLYQGRYKSFLIGEDKHLLTVIKYIERNSVRAKLSKTCEEYRWGSAWLRKNGTDIQQKLLSEPPVEFPNNYIKWINELDTVRDIERLRTSVQRGAPFGNDLWVDHMVKKHELESTIRPPGRPRKE